MNILNRQTNKFTKRIKIGWTIKHQPQYRFIIHINKLSTTNMLKMCYALCGLENVDN